MGIFAPNQAANLWAEIRPRLQSNIGSRFELRLNDPGDLDIDRKLALTIPAGIPGRRLHPSKRVFQAALPLVRGNTLSEWFVQQALERLVQRTRAARQGPVASPIRMLPLEIIWHELPQPGGQEPLEVPFGLEELRLSPFYLDLVNADPIFSSWAIANVAKQRCSAPDCADWSNAPRQNRRE